MGHVEGSQRPVVLGQSRVLDRNDDLVFSERQLRAGSDLLIYYQI